MKAEELMIGDLLTFRDCVNNSDFPILRVDGILPDSLFIRIDNSEADNEIGYEDVVGIPLTPEILEKNGWQHDPSVQRVVIDFNYQRGNFFSMDWLNKHHFDFHNLIKKGLALEAPEDMYKTRV